MSTDSGGVTEWLKGLGSKTSVRATVPGVRIAPSPCRRALKSARCFARQGFLCCEILRLCIIVHGGSPSVLNHSTDESNGPAMSRTTKSSKVLAELSEHHNPTC